MFKANATVQNQRMNSLKIQEELQNSKALNKNAYKLPSQEDQNKDDDYE